MTMFAMFAMFERVVVRACVRALFTIKMRLFSIYRSEFD